VAGQERVCPGFHWQEAMLIAGHKAAFGQWCEDRSSRPGLQAPIRNGDRGRAGRLFTLEGRDPVGTRAIIAEANVRSLVFGRGNRRMQRADFRAMWLIQNADIYHLEGARRRQVDVARRLGKRLEAHLA